MQALTKFLILGTLTTATLPMTLSVAATDDASVATEMNVDSVTTDTSSRQAKLRKLQILNRVYQICYGRSIRPSEAAKLIGMTKTQIIKELLTSGELRQVFANRLAEYEAGPSSTGTGLRNPDRANALMTKASPTTALASILSSLNPKRHGGRSCTGKTTQESLVAVDSAEARCFSEWLIGHTAPALSVQWLDAQSIDYKTMDYARLLERIVGGSL